MFVAERFGQAYTVITVDQALYCKLMEMKWRFPEFNEKLIVRLGGLHISMSFLKVIGKHMSGSGLYETWIESGLLGEGAAELVFSGKAYSKAMRAHKITVQALWTILMPKLMSFLPENNSELHSQISSVMNDDNKIAELVSILQEEQYCKALAEFVTTESHNVNFKFWWQYIEMFSILLLFTRAQREGIWELHLESFTKMIPLFMRYDHFNYARWGIVYLAEMKQLPDEVKKEFVKGNFVVKCSSNKFNQVDPDHAQEWLNGTGKRAGGIVGITKSVSALMRWSLSFNLRSHMANKTHEMYDMLPDKSIAKETTPSRSKRDGEDEQALLDILQRFKVFSDDAPKDILWNIATKDLASDEIQWSLLSASNLGQEEVIKFVRDRILNPPASEEPPASFYDPIKRQNAPTFESLYEIPKKGNDKEKKTVVKADRNILVRLITAYQSGRQVDLPKILSHELFPVPLSLAEINGSLRTGNKSILIEKLAEGLECPPAIDLFGKSSCMVIDGQALVVSLGKPKDSLTFGDLSDTFLRAVLQIGKFCQRIDVVFDRCWEHSIKETTRKRRSKTSKPIRRVIENRDVPLPKNWSNFMALPENKADLARFLSEQLITRAPESKEIVTAGGFRDVLEVRSSRATTDQLLCLSTNHEEADTRVALHAMNAFSDAVVVSARDTDVLIILVSHFHRMQCKELWMKAGTSKKQKYIPVHEIARSLSTSCLQALIPFHAITGCDTTSYISGNTKASAWKVFKEHHAMLKNLGEDHFNEENMKSAEKFIWYLYNASKASSVNEARHILFFKKGKPEALPPTSDALHHHIKRAHYQSMVWKKAHDAIQVLPSPCDWGWETTDAGVKPVLMTAEAIPPSSMEMIYCNCRTQCKSQRCKCRKAKLLCTALCGCKDGGDEEHCMNKN